MTGPDRKYDLYSRDFKAGPHPPIDGPLNDPMLNKDSADHRRPRSLEALPVAWGRGIAHGFARIRDGLAIAMWIRRTERGRHDHLLDRHTA